MIPCIIPARGGSKGIPRKNVREFCGRPLIAWSIAQAQAAKHVTDVWVTTDDEDIAAIASEYGAKVHHRSPHTATDDAASELAIAECMHHISGRYARAIVFLQATSPLRQPHDIDNCVEMVLHRNADSVFSYRRVEGYTWRAGDTILSPQYSKRLPRQQQSVHTLEENGSIYAFKPWVLLDTGNRLGGVVAGYGMHVLDSLQIDAPEDWETLSQIAKVRYGSH